MAVQAELFDSADDQILLFFNDFADSRVVDSRMYIALHHRAAFIVLNVAFPSFSGHAVVLAETLLSEITQRQIIRVSH